MSYFIKQNEDCVDVRYKFLNENGLISVKRPLDYANLLESLAKRFDCLDDMSILISVNRSDFLVSLESQHDFDAFLAKHKHVSDFETSFELHLSENNTFKANNGIFIPESTEDFDLSNVDSILCAVIVLKPSFTI